MKGLDSLDWIVIVTYFIVLLGIDAWVIMQKKKNTTDYFLS
jgi:SSS family solute:Na+ symporter